MPWHGGRNRDLDWDAAFLAVGGGHGGDGIHQFGQVEGHGFDLNHSGLHFGKVEDVLQQRGQVGGALAKQAEFVPAFLVEAIGPEVVGNADDTVHGVADFVADAGEEFVLGGVGLDQFSGADLDEDLQFLVAGLQLALAVANDCKNHQDKRHNIPDVGPGGAIPRRQDAKGKHRGLAGQAGGVNCADFEPVVAFGEIAELKRAASARGGPLTVAKA